MTGLWNTASNDEERRREGDIGCRPLFHTIMNSKPNVPARINCLLPSDVTRAAKKTTPPTIRRCHGNAFTELLPSNDKHRHPQIQKNKTNSVAFSLRANSTDRATATGRRIVVPTFAGRGVSRSQRGGSPTAANLGYLDRCRYLSFK
jgi:hypothetical protein